MDQYDRDVFVDRPDPTQTALVSHLAQRVVSVLKARQSQEQIATRRYVSAFLDQHLVSRAAFDPQRVLAELRALHVSNDKIVDAYIPSAARLVGQRWVDDEMCFADVTIASVRLQSLLGEIDDSTAFETDPLTAPARFMVAICAGDQHSLGGFVLASQLRRRGMAVDLVCAEPPASICQSIMRGRYDAVLFSCSRASALDSVARIVQDVRTHGSGGPHFCLGGIALDMCEDVGSKTGVDLVTNDLGAVLRLCDHRPQRVREVALE